MRNKENKHISLELNPELHYKIRYIANYNARSINKQMIYLAQQCVKEFETSEGKIEVKIEDKKTT